MFIFSLLPDIDFIISVVRHRGITHSLFALLFVSIILLRFNYKESFFYVVTYFSHIFADLITANGVLLYAPLSTRFIILRALYIPSKYLFWVEVTLFLMFLIALLLTGDYRKVWMDSEEFL